MHQVSHVEGIKLTGLMDPRINNLICIWIHCGPLGPPSSWYIPYFFLDTCFESSDINSEGSTGKRAKFVSPFWDQIPGTLRCNMNVSNGHISLQRHKQPNAPKNADRIAQIAGNISISVSLVSYVRE